MLTAGSVLTVLVQEFGRKENAAKKIVFLVVFFFFNTGLTFLVIGRQVSRVL